MKRKTGFLLIELVVAIAVFTLFMKAILNLQAQILVSQKNTRLRLQACELTQRTHEGGGHEQKA